MMERDLALLVVLAALATGALAPTPEATPAARANGAVHAWEEALTIPTCPLGPREPNHRGAESTRGG